jgi:poly(3-hydroxybutyrate) depolymerase
MKRFIYFIFLLSILLHGSYARALFSLPGYNAVKDQTTVSGFSSGAFMAVQLHIAHSKTIKGVGVFAGGPYYCSKGSVSLAWFQCMKPFNRWFSPNVRALVSKAETLAKEGRIDPLEHLHDSKVWIFSGQKDTVVAPIVVKALEDYYKNFMQPKNIAYRENPKAGHALITNDYGNDCSLNVAPYINKCGYDGTGEMLAYLYGTLSLPSKESTGSLLEFDQTEFFGEQESPHISLASKGYAYIPEVCNLKQCRIHVFLHGCLQNAETVGKQVVEHSGLNRWADSNGLIILYPQTTSWKTASKSASEQTKTENPSGCWDWWGYSNADYYSKEAPQIKAVMKMINRLTEARKEA